MVVLIKLVELLSCYICFDWSMSSGSSDVEYKDTFRFEPPRSEISWIMRKSYLMPDTDAGPPTETKPNRTLRTEDFRSTVDIGCIPDNGLDFFTLFVHDLHRKWIALLKDADSHLAENVSNFESSTRNVMNNFGLVIHTAQETLAKKRENRRFHRYTLT